MHVDRFWNGRNPAALYFGLTCTVGRGDNYRDFTLSKPESVSQWLCFASLLSSKETKALPAVVA